MSFSELKQKDVINICDGRKLGRPIDLILSDNACVEALVVPGGFDFLALLRGEKKGLVIPWPQICRIGDDVILVRFDAEN